LQGVRAALIANEMASIHVEVVDTDARSKIATIEETKPLRTFAHKHAKGVLLVLFVLLMAVVVTYFCAFFFGLAPGLPFTAFSSVVFLGILSLIYFTLRLMFPPASKPPDAVLRTLRQSAERIKDSVKEAKSEGDADDKP
jgi:hypothetical protein